jgi:hypothetical protein
VKKFLNQTFQDHIETLFSIIRGKAGQSVKDQQVLLAKYVVASSYRKMYGRITHKNSKPYMKGLLKISNSLSMADYQQLEPFALTSRDKTFLMSIQQIVSKSSHDASRCKDIDCKFNCEYKLHLPELCRIADTAKTSTETSMFYTEATFTEYHCLLVNLLEHFKLHLCALVAGKGDTHLNLNMVRYFGSELHNMVSSRIMDGHLRKIEKFLWQAINNPEEAGQADGAATKGGSKVKSWFSGKATETTKAVAEAGDDEGAGAAEMEGGDGFDDSIASVQMQAIEYETSDRRGEADRSLTGGGSMLASRCCQWLRLMTTYFDAMDQLVPSELTLPRLPNNTAVQVIAVQHPGKKRMDWKDCLLSLPNSEKFPNGDELVEKFIDHYSKGDQSLFSWFDPETGSFTDDTFPGSRHCEAIILTLIFIQRTGKGLMKLLPELENLLGISKRCCPVCAFLIKHLQGFVIRGEHKTVHPCSLPPWLPEKDMQVMVNEFAKRLRNALDELLFSEPQTESQARLSSGSTSLSVMSYNSDSMPAGLWAADLEEDE